jgi:diguanylate cyclase (GGDEF)-like protein
MPTPITAPPILASANREPRPALARGTGTFAHVARLAQSLFGVADASVRTLDDGDGDGAGVPSLPVVAEVALRAVDGTPLGTLALHDPSVRTLTADEGALLADLALVAERDLAARKLATQDELTGLANRRGFLAAATDALAICARSDQPATLLYFDLDGFKAINDSRGHAAGDRALRGFATWLRATFRASDVVGRLGGDEFVVLATRTGAEAIAGALERLHHALDVSGEGLGFSVGIAEFDGAAPASVDALMATADANMFVDKAARRAADDVSLARQHRSRVAALRATPARERRAAARLGR